MTMTYEEVLEKIKSSGKVTITETKAVQHAQVIKLSNGGIINCYNTGKITFQGKSQDETRAIIEDVQTKIGNRKIFVVYGHDDIARTQLEALLRRWDLEPIYNVPLVKTQMKKIIVTAKTLYSHPKNVSKIYAALHTDLAW